MGEEEGLGRGRGRGRVGVGGDGKYIIWRDIYSLIHIDCIHIT